MNFHFSREQVADYSELTCLDGDQSAMLNSMTTASESSHSVSETESYPTPPSFATSEHSLMRGTPQAIREWLMSLQGDSPANPLALPESSSESMIQETCGLPHGIASAWLDPVTVSLKTFQACLIADISEPSLETWPKAGIVCDGEFYPQPKWEHRIDEIDSGSWPTPRANKIGGYSSPEFSPTLEQAVKMWPTPTVDAANERRTKYAQGGTSLSLAAKMWSTPRQFMHKDTTTDRGKGNLGEVVGGKLNPTWVEWLMNWPLGWTSLESLPKDYFNDWERRTQTSAADVRGRDMRIVWWDNDPSETPQRREPTQQQSRQHTDSLSGVPQERAPESRNMGQGDGSTSELRDMWGGISTRAQSQEGQGALRESRVLAGEGEASCHETLVPRIATGVKNRADRLKAIGNGQVPAVVRAAWRLLSGA